MLGGLRVGRDVGVFCFRHILNGDQVKPGRDSDVGIVGGVAGLWYCRDSYTPRTAQVSDDHTMISALKDLPVKAVPFVIFPGACAVFGELFIRMPTADVIPQIVGGGMAVCTIASALLFFTKIFLDWPPIHGLELPD